MEYSETYLEHFQNPRNVGEIDAPDSIAEVEYKGGGCFDRIRITLKLSEERIGEIMFKARACSGTIASVSAATEWAKGKNLKEALRLTPENLEDILGGVPEQKRHSLELAAEAVREAARGASEK